MRFFAILTKLCLIICFMAIIIISYIILWIIKKINYNLRINYLNKYGIIYDDSNLITIGNKINWLIIHDTNKLKVKCADKILLHKYSKFKIGKDICNKIYKIYQNPQQIDFNELPNNFVIKTNHGSGFNIIVDNKTDLNYTNVKETLNDWMKIDYGKLYAEFHYSYIKRKIFVEEFIGNDLKNYKFLCYNGKPKYVYLSISENHTKYRNFYDMNWNFLNYSCLSEPHPYLNFSKPKHFDLMKEYAKILSSDFIFVRVDLYQLENEVRLGELTFSPMGGFFFCKNKTDEIELGKDLNVNI